MAGYGQQPQTGYGSHAPLQGQYQQPPHGQYSAPPPPGQHGAPPPQGGYGAPPPQGGYGAPPPQGGYGAPPPQAGYGAPPPHGGYGQHPQQYGAPPPQHGYAQQPRQGQGHPQGGIPKVGIFKQYQLDHPTTIVLKEHVLSLTGDSFSIKTADGTPLLQVEGKIMSISGRKKIRDMSGNHLFDIVKEHLHIHTTFAAEDPQGQKLLEVKSSFKLFGSKATGTILGPQPHVLEMKGSIFDTRAEIIDKTVPGNPVAARIDRKLLSGKDIFFGQQTYAVTVEPGYDLALIAAMCICLDEKNNET